MYISIFLIICIKILMYYYYYFQLNSKNVSYPQLASQNAIIGQVSTWSSTSPRNFDLW